jgi:cation diffusion facilitator family transporter
MPDPKADPNAQQIRHVARRAVLAGVVITLLKFIIFFVTNSVAVLSDAFESIINVVAAGVMLYSIYLSNQPADADHPYGHGKVQFLAVGFEGWLILAAGLTIGIMAVGRLLGGVEPVRLDLGIWMLGGVGLLSGVLAFYVWSAGRKYGNLNLIADGWHLTIDVASTFGVLGALLLVKWTTWHWLDPVVAIILAAAIMYTSWRLLWQSINGLMDRRDPEDDRVITRILDDEVAQGHICGYHKVHHRHAGTFHWVEMHLQVDGDRTVRQGHALASAIEGRIENQLGQANATAHLEPPRE